MIDRTYHSKKVEPKAAAAVSTDAQCSKEELTDEELEAFEEALMWAYPTPEDDEAFREHLRKNGSGGGDP